MSCEKDKRQILRVLVSLVLGLLLPACLVQSPSLSQSGTEIPGEVPSASPTLAPTPKGKPQSLPITAIATIAGNKIELEVARTIKEQATGLMHRPSLAPNRGMLFLFNAPQETSFWMKNCLIPLDMVFIRQGRVVGIAANSPPCTSDPCPVYRSPAPIDQVLELAGGRAAQLGLKTGDALPIKFLGKKP